MSSAGSDYESDEWLSDQERESDDGDSSNDGDYGLAALELERTTSATYTVFEVSDLERKRDEAVDQLVSVLNVTRGEAALLLRVFKWNVTRVLEDWFADEEGVRERAGLVKEISSGEDGVVVGVTGVGQGHPQENDPPKTPAADAKMTEGAAADGGAEPATPQAVQFKCGICLDELSGTSMRSAGCGHPFCVECWGDYMSTSVDDGPSCLNLRCPMPGCGVVVPDELVAALTPAKSLERRRKFEHHSIVDDNPALKWCPGVDCGRAIECTVARVAGPSGGASSSAAGGGGGGGGGGGTCAPVDIRCKCGHSFCWSCNKEAHRPVDCETVDKWVRKNGAESENVNWLLANTKPCPKCKRPIEKNQGCMHMTCQAPCGYEFCWLCLGAWKDHGERTGGFYACNRYEEAKQQGQYESTEKRRIIAKNSLERYMHYYERWAEHDNAHKKAQKDVGEMASTLLERLGDIQNTPASQLRFVTDAIQQVAECRRILKWTYAFGYYKPSQDQNKKRFFEYIQGEAEHQLERLSEAVEIELGTHMKKPSSDLSPEQAIEAFNEFRGKLGGLTAVTHKSFSTLISELESWPVPEGDADDAEEVLA